MVHISLLLVHDTSWYRFHYFLVRDIVWYRIQYFWYRIQYFWYTIHYFWYTMWKSLVQISLFLVHELIMTSFLTTWYLAKFNKWFFSNLIFFSSICLHHNSLVCITFALMQINYFLILFNTLGLCLRFRRDGLLSFNPWMFLSNFG